MWSRLTETVQLNVSTRKSPEKLVIKELIITGVREAVEQNPVLPTGIQLIIIYNSPVTHLYRNSLKHGTCMESTFR